jgi:hypothetical protein
LGAVTEDAKMAGIYGSRSVTNIEITLREFHLKRAQKTPMLWWNCIQKLLLDVAVWRFNIGPDCRGASNLQEFVKRAHQC